MKLFCKLLHCGALLVFKFHVVYHVLQVERWQPWGPRLLTCRIWRHILIWTTTYGLRLQGNSIFPGSCSSDRPFTLQIHITLPWFARSQLSQIVRSKYLSRLFNLLSACTLTHGKFLGISRSERRFVDEHRRLGRFRKSSLIWSCRFISQQPSEFFSLFLVKS